MDTDGESHQIGNQDDPSRSVRLIGLLLPAQHQPHHKSCKHRREGIDLALDCREPECIGEGVGQRSHRTCSEHRNGIGGGERFALASEEATGNVGDGPKEEQDAEGTHQGIHSVDHMRHIVCRWCKESGNASHKHKERCPRRVSHLEFIGGSHKLAAIP